MNDLKSEQKIWPFTIFFLSMIYFWLKKVKCHFKQNENTTDLFLQCVEW